MNGPTVISLHCVRLQVGFGFFLSNLNLGVTDENPLSLRPQFNFDINIQAVQYRVRMFDWNFNKFQKMRRFQAIKRKAAQLFEVLF